MHTEPNHCAFCGELLTTKSRTKEHVWPRWLHNRFQLEKQQFQGIHWGTPWGTSVVSNRIQSFNSLVLGGICAKCNNGWMSELETKVAPLFEKLWNSIDRRHITLEFDACEILTH